jgi:hypothetical protein
MMRCPLKWRGIFRSPLRIFGENLSPRLEVFQIEREPHMQDRPDAAGVPIDRDALASEMTIATLGRMGAACSSWARELPDTRVNCAKTSS